MTDMCDVSMMLSIRARSPSQRYVRRAYPREPTGGGGSSTQSEVARPSISDTAIQDPVGEYMRRVGELINPRPMTLAAARATERQRRP